MILQIPNALHINRGVRAKDDALDVNVELDSNCIWINSDPTNSAIQIVLTLDEVRSIVRLFNVLERCPTCHGFGRMMGKDGESKPCWTCDGAAPAVGDGTGEGGS